MSQTKQNYLCLVPYKIENNHRLVSLMMFVQRARRKVSESAARRDRDCSSLSCKSLSWDRDRTKDQNNGQLGERDEGVSGTCR